MTCNIDLELSWYKCIAHECDKEDRLEALVIDLDEAFDLLTDDMLLHEVSIARFNERVVLCVMELLRYRQEMIKVENVLSTVG